MLRQWRQRRGRRNTNRRPQRLLLGLSSRLAALSLLSLVGAALVLLGAGAVILSTSFDVEANATPTGGDLSLNEGASDSTDIRSNNSPTLVRNPKRPGNLAVANRIDTPRFSCALHASFDGGASWERATPIPAPPGEEPKCFGPDVAFGADGTLYLSFVTLAGKGNVPNAVWIAKSTDGGRTLSKPRKALGRLAFQVRLAADPIHPDRLYMTWLQARDTGTLSFTGPGNPIQTARSDDGGASWQPRKRVSSPRRGRVVTPSPAVGRDGQLYVLYVDLGGDKLDYDGGTRGRGGPPYRGSFRLVLARSRDRGKSWEESVVDDKLVPIGRFVVFYPPYPSLAVDPHSGRIYAAFHDARLGDPDVLVWSLLPSGSGGWKGPTRVNDTPKHDGTSQYLPKLGVAPDGRLDVLYYDRRADPDNVKSDVSLQSSFDSGKSFTAAKKLTRRPFDSGIGFGSPEGLPDLGSRLALISDDAAALAVWTDTRSGTRLSNKQDLYRTLVKFSQPPRLASPVKDALRYGGILVALAGLALLLMPWVAESRISLRLRNGMPRPRRRA